MQATTSYESIRQNLPQQCAALESQILAKINKNKKVISLNPADWEWSFSWAQLIQSCNLAEMMSGKVVAKQEPDTVEEKVFNFFKAEDIFMTINVKANSVNASVDFPKFNDPAFYIPKEVVQAYNPDAGIEILDKPTIMLYTHKNKGTALMESYVIGGLKDKNDHKEYVVIKTLAETLMAYHVSLSDNNLEAKFRIGTKIDIKDFEHSKLVKLGKNSFYTMDSEEAMELLHAKTQWIEDSQSVLEMLLGELEKSPGFMMMGSPRKEARITQIPENAKIIPMQIPENTELKQKLKIR